MPKAPASVRDISLAAAALRAERHAALVAADDQAQASRGTARDAMAALRAMAGAGKAEPGALTVAGDYAALAELRAETTAAELAAAGDAGLGEEAKAIADFLVSVDAARQAKVREILDAVKAAVVELGDVADAVNTDHIFAGSRFLEVKNNGVELPAGCYVEPNGRLQAANGAPMLLVDSAALLVDVIQRALPPMQRHPLVVFS